MNHDVSFTTNVFNRSQRWREEARKSRRTDDGRRIGRGGIRARSISGGGGDEAFQTKYVNIHISWFGPSWAGPHVLYMTIMRLRVSDTTNYSQTSMR